MVLREKNQESSLDVAERTKVCKVMKEKVKDFLQHVTKTHHLIPCDEEKNHIPEES